jgi:hypothetical protein
MQDDEKTSLRLLLENKFNDIRYSKQQQWHLLYLTLIAIAGITSLALGITPISYCIGIFLIIFDALIAVTGCGFIIYYAYWLNIYRKEKRDYLLKLLNHSDQKRISDIVIFTISFCIIIAFSLIASIWAILIKLHPS